MNSVPASEIALNRALRGVHRSVLFTLGVCAAVIFWTADPASDGAQAPPQRLLATLAAGLGAGSILTRRRQTAPHGNPRSEVTLSVVSLLCAAAVGLLGVAVAGTGGPRTTGLVYVLAGTLFALRPPRTVAGAPRGPAP
jgi:hypothetical protein